MWIIYYMHYPYVFIYNVTHNIHMHFIIYAYTMKWGKVQILCIVVMGVGHKQEELILMVWVKWFYCLPTLKKEKKKKQNSSSYMFSYPLLSRFLNITILKKERKKPNHWSEYKCLSLSYFQYKLNNAKLIICWVFKTSLMVLLDTW